jgi:lipopolysaccharide transport system ATP-binding protein
MRKLPAIEVQNLSKQYRIGALEKKNAHLGEQLRGLIPRLFSRDKKNTIWSLKNVNFTVQPGEAWGIIGRNGAGKSTLLKVLSKITRATSGTVVTRGRVSALLEVGTGFHPELTGRENVYLNGSILGMTKPEIKRKFDDIVDFAGVGPFIDTPVKRYSSGMQLRLAFAVAAYLEPEILVIDEVLAVGDLEFQKKCLHSVEEMKGGRTVLFVSHNLGAVKGLCQKALWLEQGEVKQSGEVNSVVQAYLSSVAEISKGDSIEEKRQGGTGLIRFTSVELRDQEGEERASFMVGEQMRIRADFSSQARVIDPAFCIGIIRSDGTVVSYLHSMAVGYPLSKVSGKGFVEVTIPEIMMMPGDYHIQLWCGANRGRVVYDLVEPIARFTIISGPIMRSQLALDSRWGVIYIPASWNHQSEADGHSKSAYQAEAH